MSLNAGVLQWLSDTRKSAAASPASPVYIPINWGRTWLAKQVAAREGIGKAVAAIHGDSVGRGYHSSNLDTKSWAGMLSTRLRGAADGGSGFKSIGDSSVAILAKSQPQAMVTAYTAAGLLVTLTGTWADYVGPSGPGGSVLSTAVALSSASFRVRGTSIAIYTIGTFTYEWQVDGGAWTQVTVNGYQVWKTTLPAQSAGTHTVVVRYPSGGTGTLYLCGVSGENATGVVVNQFSRFGATSLTYDVADAINSGDWNGGYRYPCDLLIYAIGVNDNGGGTAVDTSMLNAARVIRSARDRGGRNGDVDVLFVINHCGSYNTSPNDKWHDFTARYRALAISHGAAYVDLWTAGKNSWNYWNSLGYWGDSATPGAAGSDGVHLSDAGHLAAFSQIVKVLP